MLIEEAAYANRWRAVSPAAKAGFALAGLAAAHLAATPGAALAVAALLALAACLGAGVAWTVYLRVAAPAVGFLALSCVTLLVSLDGDLHWRWAPNGLAQVAELAGRALASLAALLGLVLTTPLPDLLALLRRLRCPETLLDLMVLCYRMLFVLSRAGHDTLTAQQARLGYADSRSGLRSAGLLTANLALQVWLRAQALHRAALARNGDGPLRVMVPRYAHAGRDGAVALVAGAVLLAVAGWGR